MNIDPKNPETPDRDRFVLSKGHATPAIYSVLAHKGFFPVEDLLTLHKLGSYLQGHPNMNLPPGVEMSTGSLGQGISTACGMAKGEKYLGKDFNVYTLLGDGELDEGQVWEAVTFAAHFKLDNLCIAVDVNGLQIDGATKDVMDTSPLDKRFEAFGCAIISINGHNFDELEKAFSFFHETHDKPTVILLQTVKGKGVSFMENQVGWHGKAPNDEQLAQALVELGKSASDVVVLDADLAAATKTGVFKKAFPERHFDCGIAECNMIDVAAKFSTLGLVPFASSFAMFAAGRAFEQVRNTIGYPHLNKKICAIHGGISVGEDGASHQCCEDFALMRSITGHGRYVSFR